MGFQIAVWSMYAGFLIGLYVGYRIGLVHERKARNDREVRAK